MPFFIFYFGLFWLFIVGSAQKYYLWQNSFTVSLWPLLCGYLTSFWPYMCGKNLLNPSWVQSHNLKIMKMKDKRTLWDPNLGIKLQNLCTQHNYNIRIMKYIFNLLKIVNLNISPQYLASISQTASEHLPTNAMFSKAQQCQAMLKNIDHRSKNCSHDLCPIPPEHQKG